MSSQRRHTWLTLRSGIPVKRLRADLRSMGRVHVRQVLTASAARHLHLALTRLDWDLLFNRRDRLFIVPARERHKLSPDDEVAVQQYVWRRAQRLGRSQLQYCYQAFPAWDRWRDGTSGHATISEAVEWLNGPEFLGFARQLTGRHDIALADCSATRFDAGQFLTVHRDTGAHPARRIAAYVLNLTPQWRPDWGGALCFPQAHGAMAAFSPAFNALNVFFVPQDHFVSCVAPYAARSRYALTGWLRSQ